MKRRNEYGHFIGMNWALMAPLMILQLILMDLRISELCKTREDKKTDQNGCGFYFILFVNLTMSGSYFLIGRKNR